MPISARKLAASFWVHYGGLKLDQDDEEPQDLHTTESQNHRSLSPATLNTHLYNLTLADSQTSGSSKLTRESPIVESRSNNSMATSQAATLLNVVHRMRSIEEGQSQNVAVLNKLRLDVDNAASRIRELEFSHKSTLREINTLLQRIGEQMAVSRRNEQEKVRLTFLHLHEEMEEERNTCRLLQIQNQKLSEDLSHANLAAADACEELNRERKARELLEEVCNELAREIGEDKAEVEQLKQEQEKSRERLEKELKMMEMAALWREQKVRNKLEEAKMELEYGGKQVMPLHELGGKLEAVDNMAVVGECSTFQDENKKRAVQTKLLTQVLERTELDKTSSIEHNIGNISCTTHLSSVPAWLDAHFSKESTLNVDCHSRGETVNTSGIEQRGGLNVAKKHRRLRRRLRTSVQQGQFNGLNEPEANLFDARSSDLCGEGNFRNSGSSSSDDKGDGRNSFTQQSCTPHKIGVLVKMDTSATPKLHSSTRQSCTPQKIGLLVEMDTSATPKLHDSTNRDADASIEGKQIMEERMPPVFSSFSKHTRVENGTSCLDSFLNNASSAWSPKKHSSSARFEVGKLNLTSEADEGRKMQHYFSDDDASSHIASQSERERKSDGRMSQHLPRKVPRDQTGLSYAKNRDRICILKGRGGGEAVSGYNSELDDIFFEPVKEPAVALHDKTNHKTEGDDERVIQPRLEGDLGQDMRLGKCGNDSCCGVISKCGQVCKELKAAEKSGCRIVVASQDVEGSLISGSQENTTKMSPWKSATGKPLQCLWPPSPDAFSIFGGSKRRIKADSSIPVNVGSDSGLARRQASPAKQVVHHQPVVCQEPDFPCMRSKSLGAQLIKARVCDLEKPPKSSFRISHLRRATSHG